MDELQHHLCIVLASSDDESLRPLMEQLAALDCRIEQHHSAAEAFARTCLCHRAHLTAVQSESRAGSAERPALIMTTPDQPELPAILTASDRRLPLSIWLWHDGRLENLRAGSPVAAPTIAEAQAIPQPRRDGPPQLRLSQPFDETQSPALEAWSDPLPALDDPSGAAEDAQHLSSQEIDMLLDIRRQEGDP